MDAQGDQVIFSKSFIHTEVNQRLETRSPNSAHSTYQ